MSQLGPKYVPPYRLIVRHEGTQGEAVRPWRGTAPASRELGGLPVLRSRPNTLQFWWDWTARPRGDDGQSDLQSALRPTASHQEMGTSARTCKPRSNARDSLAGIRRQSARAIETCEVVARKPHRTIRWQISCVRFCFSRVDRCRAEPCRNGPQSRSCNNMTFGAVPSRS